VQISKQEVEHVARLARLELTEAEQDAFSRQLSSILAYMAQLDSVDIAGVEPTATVVGQTNVFREDEVRPSLSVEKALANAPETEESHFVVPRIIEDR
jgi:aspartyl-tRNA(Asn)/glutamyl-tRNA(Gln) amidotransferase subunit C